MRYLQRVTITCGDPLTLSSTEASINSQPDASPGTQGPITRLPHGDGLALPAYATEHAAGMDLAAAVTDPVVLEPGARALIPTGMALALPQGSRLRYVPGPAWRCATVSECSTAPERSTRIIGVKSASS